MCSFASFPKKYPHCFRISLWTQVLASPLIRLHVILELPFTSRGMGRIIFSSKSLNPLKVSVLQKHGRPSTAKCRMLCRWRPCQPQTLRAFDQEISCDINLTSQVRSIFCMQQIPLAVCDRWTVSPENRPDDLCRCHTKWRIGSRGPTNPSFGMTPTIIHCAKLIPASFSCTLYDVCEGCRI